MNYRFVGLLFLASLLSNQIRAQALWVFVGGSISAELQKDFGDLGEVTAIPISVVFSKQISPKFSWAIAPTFEIYKNTFDFSTGQDTWKKTNIELPFIARYHLAGIKAVSFGTGAYIGITLKSRLQSSGGDQKVETRSPYFGIPVWIEFALRRFGLGFRANFQLTDVSPKEFPANNSSLFEQYEDIRTTRISFQLAIGYRII